MTPTHSTGLGAARRVKTAIEAGQHADAHDAMLMHTYQISLELRRVPQAKRLKMAHRLCRWIVNNTQESLG